MSNYKVDIKDTSSNTQTFNFSIPLSVGNYRLRLNTENSSPVISSGDVITVNENENHYKVTFNLTDGTSITPDTLLVTDRVVDLEPVSFSMDVYITAVNEVATIQITNLGIYNPNNVRVEVSEFGFTNGFVGDVIFSSSDLIIGPDSSSRFVDRTENFNCSQFNEAAGHIYMYIIPYGGSYDPNSGGYLYNNIIYHQVLSESDSFGDPYDTSTVTATDTQNPNIIVDTSTQT